MRNVFLSPPLYQPQPFSWHSPLAGEGCEEESPGLAAVCLSSPSHPVGPFLEGSVPFLLRGVAHPCPPVPFLICIYPLLGSLWPLLPFKKLHYDGLDGKIKKKIKHEHLALVSFGDFIRSLYKLAQGPMISQSSLFWQKRSVVLPYFFLFPCHFQK